MARKRLGRVGRSTDIRLLSIALLIIGAWATIAAYLYRAQVVNAAGYAELAEKQRVHLDKTVAARGTIYDRQGRELAISVEARAIYAHPGAIRLKSDEAEANSDTTETKRTVAMALSGLLDQDTERLMKKLQSGNKFVFLARQVDVDTAAEVMAEIARLGVAGIHVLPESKRVYPSGSLTAHTVGFVDIDSIGIEGLESRYDGLLTGEEGSVLAEWTPGRRFIPHGRLEVKPAVPGADLIISIDREIQFMAHRACVDTLLSTQAERCVVVALDPETFEVLAMVVVPSFDPSDRTESDVSSGILTNAAVHSLYEPGSTQKMVTVSAALEERVVEWDTQYLVEDTVEVVEGACEDQETEVFGCFSDFSPHPPQVMNVKDCIRFSSNVCVVKIGQDLGEEHLADYLEAFGYGEKTGIDFPGESGGSVNLPRGCPTCPASASIGYSLSVSPLQIATVYATIANDGVRMEPRLVTGIVDGEGASRLTPRSSQRVLSEDTARLVRFMLKTVVDSGTGTLAAVPGYTVGGKTGTTRKFDHALGDYTDEYVASFVGMAPIEDPRLVIAVVVDTPRSGDSVVDRTGGSIAAPLFSQVMEASLHQMGVRPDA